MKILKNTAILTSYILLVAIFFCGGYALGRKNTEPVVLYDENTAVEVNSDNVNDVSYEVKIEDGILSINERRGDDRKMLLSEKISESIYPKDDISELKTGIEFDTLDKAQSLFENFVS